MSGFSMTYIDLTEIEHDTKDTKKEERLIVFRFKFIGSASIERYRLTNHIVPASE